MHFNLTLLDNFNLAFLLETFEFDPLLDTFPFGFNGERLLNIAPGI